MKTKRIASAILCLVMALALLPATALATNYPGGWDNSQTYTDGDTITIGGTNYTYKGDVSASTLLNLFSQSASGWKPLTGNLIWKAESGYILYSYDGSTAAVTLHNATGSGTTIELPYSKGPAAVDVKTACDTTVTLEGDSAISGALNHQVGSTTFTGSGSLRMVANTACNLSGAVTVTGGAQVTLGDGNYFNNKEDIGSKAAYIDGLLTVDNGGKLTVATNTELYSGNDSNPTAYPGGIAVASGGTLENNGAIVMVNKTAADPGITGDITGSGIVKLGSISYIRADGKWVRDGGNFPSTGLDLNEINNAIVYKAGEGTVLWEPTVESGGLTIGKLTLNNATIKDFAALEVFRMPGKPVEIALEGANSIEGNGYALCAFYRCDREEPITMTGDGTIDVTTTVTSGTATLIDSGEKDTTLNGGERWGTIRAGSVALNNVTIPEDHELHLQDIVGTVAAKDTVNNGILVLKSFGNFDDNKAAIGKLNLIGDGMVKIDDEYFTNSGEKICTSGALVFGNSESVNHGVKASEAKLDVDGYEFKQEGNGYTLTLGNLLIDTEGTGIDLRTGSSVTVVLAPGATTRITPGTLNYGIFFNQSSDGINTITGSGRLIITSASEYAAIDTSNPLIIAGGDITITNTNGRGIDSSSGVSPDDDSGDRSIHITGGKLNISVPGETETIAARDSLEIGSGMKITSPDGAVVVDKLESVVDEQGSSFIAYYTLLVKDSETPVGSVTIEPAPSSGGDYTPSPVTVYNDPVHSKATIWLTGAGLGLDSGDLLVTQRNPKGSAYEALAALAPDRDVFASYNIRLSSGKKSTGSAMNLSFDLNAKYAGDDFTLVHQKGDSTYEYFYDAADENGDLTFGPLYELSPFMLVKGTLLAQSAADIPQTGDGAQTALWAGAVLVMISALLAGAALCKRKKD